MISVSDIPDKIPFTEEQTIVQEMHYCIEEQAQLFLFLPKLVFKVTQENTLNYAIHFSTINHDFYNISIIENTTQMNQEFETLDPAYVLEMNDAHAEYPISFKKYIYYKELIDLENGKYKHLSKDELKEKKKVWRQTEIVTHKKGQYYIDNALQVAYFTINENGNLEGEVKLLSKFQADTWHHFFYNNGKCLGFELRNLDNTVVYKKEVLEAGHSITLWDAETGKIISKEIYEYEFSTTEPASTANYDENGNVYSIYDAKKQEKILAAPKSTQD